MKTGKFNIFLSFESMEDRDAVLKALERHSKITWNNDLMQSDIEIEPKKFTVNVKKGVLTPPKRLRL